MYGDFSVKRCSGSGLQPIGEFEEMTRNLDAFTVTAALNKFNVKTESYKFPPFKINDINMRINKLKKILKIKKNLKCKLLSDKTILIK